jgi:hypothetical protein
MMNKYLSGILFLIFVLAGTSFAQGVDPQASGGVNFTMQTPAKNIYLDNNGTGGDGSIEKPYGPFSEINWTTIAGWVADGKDVNINLKRGVVWREQLTVKASRSERRHGLAPEPKNQRHDRTST